MSIRKRKTYASVQAMIASGFARVSNSSCTVSRLDRQDWREHMASKHSFGMKWVDGLERQKHAADQYRRCYSQDKLEVSRSMYKNFPPSSPGPQEYMHDKALEAETKMIAARETK